MIINILDLTYDSDGAISKISVTDGNQVMEVTPYMIFDAMLNGRMESQTARLNIYGLDVIVNGVVTNIHIDLTKEQKQLVKNRLGISVEKEKKTSKKEVSAKAEQVKQVQKAKAEKEARLAAEREAYRIKQQQWFEENQRKADEARAKGLVNLSVEESRRLRKESFKK